MTVDIVLFIALLLSLIGSLIHRIPLSILSPFLMTVGVVATVPVGISAFRALFRKKITVDLLATIALVVSIVQQEWESVVFLNLMITSARIFGGYTEGKAHAIIQKLLKLRPNRVKVKTKDGIKECDIHDVKVGDLVLIESGDRIPVDGIVEMGNAVLDQSSLTGESVPVTKIKGDRLLSSTLATGGSLYMRVTHVGEDTEFEKIIQLVKKAQNEKVGIQTTADTFASWYIVIIFAGSLVLYLASHKISLVLSVLLVTCADDLAVAIPLAFWAALGYAAKRGIIVKGTSFLEGVTRIKTFIVDKTGTLTKGHIKVQKIGVYGDTSWDAVLLAGATIAQVSHHPLAKAIFLAAKKKGLHIPSPYSKFHEYPGKGMVMTEKKRSIIMGNAKFLAEQGVALTKEQQREIASFEKDGYTTIGIGQSHIFIGCIMLSDTLRPYVKEIIEDIKSLGVTRIVMLTGDNPFVARHVTAEIGIEEFHAHMLPEDKVAFVKKTRGEKKPFAFIGDGVNDAPALVGADIGIAMGAIGSDAAIEAADIALMNDDITKIPEVIRIGKETLAVAYQNFFIWGIVNAVGLALVFCGVLGPRGAAAYNFLTDFLPLLNSSRLFWTRITPLRHAHT